MRIQPLALAFSFCLLAAAAAAQNNVASISLNGEILLPLAFSSADSPFAYDANSPSTQQTGGYYKPVTPIPYHRACGTVSTDICEVPVTVPPGATGEQVYQMMKQAANSGRNGEALSYLEKSAELGYPPAEGALGVDYLRGIGKQADPEKGIYWLNLSAQQGDRSAQVFLGAALEDGSDNVRRDETRAIALFKQAAAQHQSLAEYRLGIDYEIGRGLPHNRALALEYLRRAAADGQSQAEITASFLARAGSSQYHSVGELDAAMDPPATAQQFRNSNAYSTVGLPCPTWVQTRYTWASWCRTNPGCPINYNEARDGKQYFCPK
jgi:hypothetical protein